MQRKGKAYTMSETKIKWLKAEYPRGTKIQLDHMSEDPNPIPDGTKGVVLLVDDVGTIHCQFENHRNLGILPDVDRFHKISDE